MKKRNDREVYLGAIGVIVLVFALGVIVVERVANETIASYEEARSRFSATSSARLIPAPLLEQEVSTAVFTMPEPTLSGETAATSSAARSGRYAEIELSAGDYETLARLVWLEARGEPFEGQVAVVEVVLNRILSPSFPDTVDGVVYQTEPVRQFTPARYIETTTPTETQYRAVETALSAERPITAADVVYFFTEPENDRVYAEIGNHVFCRE